LERLILFVTILLKLILFETKMIYFEMFFWGLQLPFSSLKKKTFWFLTSQILTKTRFCSFFFFCNKNGKKKTTLKFEGFCLDFVLFNFFFLPTAILKATMVDDVGRFSCFLFLLSHIFTKLIATISLFLFLEHTCCLFC